MHIDVKELILLHMLEQLRAHGSWGGETHLQKAMYVLGATTQQDTGFPFVLYRHGPYSFDLHDALGYASARCLIDFEVHPPYGPKLRLTELGKEYLRQGEQHIARMTADITSVAQWFGGKGVGELEKLATAIYVRHEDPTASDDELAIKIHQCKPHVSLEEARRALDEGKHFRA